MSNETKIPAELFQLSGENVRKAAEKGLTQTREAFDKFNATAKDAAGRWKPASASSPRACRNSTPRRSKPSSPTPI